MAQSPFLKEYGAAVLPSAVTGARAGIAPTQAWALKGCVLTPDTTLDPGWVVVDGSQIQAVKITRSPPDVPWIDTKGVILPGLIDLHGHPNWNVLAPWEPPAVYSNRREWRESDIHQQAVVEPMENIRGKWPNFIPRAQRLTARYGEIRALVGGATAIQGDNPDLYDRHFEPLARHVDFGPAAALVFPVDASENLPGTQQKVAQELAANEITALYAHVGEGTDEESRAELDQLETLGLLTSATIIIHGIAFETPQLQKIKDVGAKLVWSPQSELRLYGQAGSFALARNMGIPIGLGADWLPSGSVSLLDEIQIARRILAQQSDFITPKALVEMVTSAAAHIAGLSDTMGHLSAGHPADLLVLERHHEDPYESVCRSGRSSVELVVIDGRLFFGRDEWFVKLAPNAEIVSSATPLATGEGLWAWGKRMRLDLGGPASAPHLGKPSKPSRLGFPLPFPHLLRGIRRELLNRDPRIGPIFA